MNFCSLKEVLLKYRKLYVSHVCRWLDAPEKSDDLLDWVLQPALLGVQTC